MSKYAHSAAQLAERMGTFREKELGMRDAFRKHVERCVSDGRVAVGGGVCECARVYIR